ncbi:MAG: hypothetical protein JW797_01140 [Bradymonadales bacterium]|nr:hypothetical protein [Bradymonadales bacterium]
MPTLREILLTEDKRPLVFQDCQQLLEQEVSKSKGVSGIAVKTGFKVVKTFRKGFLPAVIADLVPDFCEALEPLHLRHCTRNQGTFGQYMNENEEEVSRALLSVTDAKADQSSNRTLKKLYYRLRDSAERHVLSSVQGLAQLMDKHYGQPKLA